MNTYSEEHPGEEKTAFYVINGLTVYSRNTERVYYLACPNDDCKKKVNEEGDGFRCENCDKTYQSPNPKYILSLLI